MLVLRGRRVIEAIEVASEVVAKTAAACGPKLVATKRSEHDRIEVIVEPRSHSNLQPAPNRPLATSPSDDPIRSVSLILSDVIVPPSVKQSGPSVVGALAPAKAVRVNRLCADAVFADVLTSRKEATRSVCGLVGACTLVCGSSRRGRFAGVAISDLLLCL